MVGILELIRDQRSELPLIPNESNCKGKTFIIIGANTGLGFEAAKHLVRFKSAQVIMACRSLARGETAKQTIEKDTGVTGVAEVWQCDIGNFESVKKFAKRCEGLERLDAAVLNASIAYDEYETTEGFEITLGVNVVGNFLLAHLLLPKLSETAGKTGKKTTLTIIGSDTAFWAAGTLEKIPSGDMLELMSVKSFAPGKDMYPLSKLLQLYGVREMAARNPVIRTGVIINYTNPGLCYSDLNRPENIGLFRRKQIDLLRFLLARTTEVGSRTLLAGVFVPETSHGKYHSECIEKNTRCPVWITGPSGQKVQKRVWESLTYHLNMIQPTVAA